MEDPNHKSERVGGQDEEHDDLEGENEIDKAAAVVAADDESLLDAVDQIDYSKYENPGLRTAIETILDVPGTLKFFLRIAFLAFWLCLLLIVWFLRDKGWITLGAAVFGGLFASMFVSMFLALTLSVRRVLNEMVSVIDKALDIVAQVVADVGNVGDDGIVATTAKVFGGVSRNIVLPIVENVVKAQLGFLGRPLLWLYRKVFVKTVDSITNRILLAASSIKIPGQEKLGSVSDSVSGRLKSGAETADWVLAVVRPYVVGTSRWLMIGLVLPGWILFGAAVTFTTTLVWVAHRYG